MSELLNRFTVLDRICEENKREIKIFHVFNKYHGKQNVLFITSDDKVFSFGVNDFGCCGLGHNSVVNEPQIIPELCHKNIYQFFIGGSYILGLTSDKQVYGWGDNTCGQLGRGFISGRDEYLKPEIIYFPSESIIQLSCGSDHTLALSCDGRVYGWGSNKFGQIGCGRENGKNIINPIQLQTIIPFSIKYLNASYFRSYALTTDGLVYSWGWNTGGSLGHEFLETNCIFEPKLIENIPKMLFVCPSSSSTYFITIESDLYFCGHSRDIKNNHFFQMTPKLLNNEIKFASLHSLDRYISGIVSAIGDKRYFYRVNEKSIEKLDNYTYFDFYSIEYEMCYKTIHINSENISDGNYLNDLHNYKVFKYMFEILGELGAGGFGKVYKAKNNYDLAEFAIKEVLFKGKLFIIF